MQLTTLVDILEREMPGIGDNASTRSNLARLYAERGLHDDATRAEPAAGAPVASAQAGSRQSKAAFSGTTCGKR